MALPKGCGRVSGSVSAPPPAERSPDESDRPRKEVPVSVRVGQKGPEFTAPAYHRGTFSEVSLSDFAGKWVLLCFYPGDFTFV